MSDRQHQCRHCAAWHKGQCRRGPPQVIWAAGGMFTGWPQTRPTETCGRFVRKTVDSEFTGA